MCGEPIDEDGLDICEDCIASKMTFENAYAMGKAWGEDVRINEFFTSIFNADQINHILCAVFKLLPDDEQKKHIYNYCNDDLLYFVGWINGKR
jgi:hypothetical protein